jgi:hypothetical protein
MAVPCEPSTELPGLTARLDKLVFGAEPNPDSSQSSQEIVDAVARARAIERMQRYTERQLARGAKLFDIIRHIQGLYAGEPGAQEFRRTLSEGALRPGDHLVGFTIGTTAVWPYVAGVVLQLDQRGVRSTVGPAGWELYFGHERAPGRAVDVAFTLDLAGAPVEPRQTVVAEIDGTVLTVIRARG